MALPAIAIPIIGDVIKGIFDTIDRMIPDADLAAKMKHEVMIEQMKANEKYLDIAAKESSDQAEINKAEATSGNWFAAGWRPSLGYVCVAGFFYNFIGYPMLQWYVAAYKAGFTPPPLISDNLVELTFGMLGLGMMRTYEKIKGTAK
jgi:hypothetical protein